MKRRQQFSVWSVAICSSLFFFVCDCQKCDVPPSSCGSIRNISYPFRLKTDPPYCGVRIFELRCEANQTIFYLNSQGYYVEEISYENQTLRLVDIELANGSCPLPGNILTTSDSVGPFKTYDNRFEPRVGVFLLKCSGSIENPKYIPFLSNCSRSDYSYFFVDYEITTEELKDQRCHVVGAAPLQSWVDINRNFSFSEIRGLLRMGFDLWWDNSTIINWDCEFNDKGGVITSSCRWQWDDSRNVGFFLAAAEKLWSYFKIWSFIGILLIARTLFGLLFSLHLMAYKLDWRHQSTDTIEGFLESHQSLKATRYSYSEIKMITDDFREKLGAGGFGSVYKGTLLNGCLAAVKMLSKSKGSGDDFINEVSTIGRIHHVNVVRLLGFCSEGSKRALIYEFMPNGSLEKYIFSNEGTNQSLDWEKLFEIALGTARGIDYLHRGCDVRILHFDIKPHNILLDKSFNPKVSDFGLAKLCPVDYSVVSMTIAARGTIGYIAPELFSRNFGGVSYKSDVYSFGMLLLEMAGKRKNVNAFANKTSQIYFPSWVYDRLNQGGDLEIGSITEVDEEIAKKMAIVGLWCIQMKPIDRPSMSKVLEMLEGDIKLLEMPPKPFLSSPRRHTSGDLSSSESDIETGTASGIETDASILLDASRSGSK